MLRENDGDGHHPRSNDCSPIRWLGWGRGAVWPFDTVLNPPDASAVIVKVYPSLLKKKAAARKHEHEILGCIQVRVNVHTFARPNANGALVPTFADIPSLTPMNAGGWRPRRLPRSALATKKFLRAQHPCHPLCRDDSTRGRGPDTALGTHRTP